MSRREPKAGEWLRQQIAELGALRNASVRDPQFKAWRQNTLTFIQRIWPGDTSKSERFRRVPFTPPSTRHDARTAREYYERGCGEALEYLNTLRASLGVPLADAAPAEKERHPESFEGDFPEVDLGGAPPTPVGAAPPATLDDSPLDLPLASPRGEGPPELPASAGRPSALGTSGEFLASAAFLDPEAESPGHVPASGGPSVTGAPIPPALDDRTNPSRISVRGSEPREPEPGAKRVNPLADILGPARAQARQDDDRRDAAQTHKEEPPREVPREFPRETFREVPRGEAHRETFREVHRETPRETPREASHEAPKNGKKKTKVPKPRLKDMLGLSSLEQSAVETPAPPAVPVPAEADLTRETPLPDSAPLEAPPAPPAEPAAAPIVEAEPDREIPGAPDAAPAFVGGIESSGGWSLPEFMTPFDSPLAAAAPPPIEAVAPPAAPAEPSHEALSASHVESLPAPTPKVEPAPSDEDTGQAARVTAEFLDKSPVLSSVPRPVVRRGPESVRPGAASYPIDVPSNDSVASRVLAIAAEVDQLGVPEGHRARARAALMDLARQLDESDVAWDVLRDAVHFVMEFPPLARRTLPLLLPYLDRAA